MFGLTPTSKDKNQLTPTSESTLKLFSMLLKFKLRNLGSVLNKNTACSILKINSQLNPLDGLLVDSQELKDLSIAQ
jgi:hypothetical protein